MFLNRIKIHIALLLAVSAGTVSLAQGTGLTGESNKEFPIYFKLGSDKIDIHYKDNALAISGITDLLKDRNIHVNRIVMVATTSPEGSVRYNERLAQRRADAFTTYFSQQKTPLDDRIEISTSLFSWDDLAQKVELDDNVPYRNKVLEILESDKQDKIISELKDIDSGLAYQYLEDKYLSKMRSSGCLMVYYTDRNENRSILIDALKSNPPLLTLIEEEFLGLGKIKERVRYPVFAFRTNLLLPLTNIGFEAPLGNRVSISGDFYSPWLNRKDDHRNCLQAQAVNADLKFWLGRKHESGRNNRQYRLRGHAIGLYANAGQYDFEYDFSGRQGEFISSGIEYTYSLTGKKNFLRWQFTVGAGAIYHQYYDYDVYNEGGQFMTRRQIKTEKPIGPAGKAEISLVIPIDAHYEIFKEAGE